MQQHRHSGQNAQRTLSNQKKENQMIHDYEFTHEQDCEANMLRDYILASQKATKVEDVDFFEFFGIEDDCLSVKEIENG